MIVCRKCGLRNGDTDTFCGTCGSFLEWTGEKQTPAPEPAPPPSDEAEEAVAPPPPKVGLLQRVMDGANAVIAGPRPPVSQDAAAASPAPKRAGPAKSGTSAQAGATKPGPRKPSAAKPAAAEPSAAKPAAAKPAAAKPAATEPVQPTVPRPPGATGAVPPPPPPRSGTGAPPPPRPAVPPAPGQARAVPPAPGQARAVPPPSAARTVPPSPGQVRAVPPAPGQARAVPPASGQARAVPPAPGQARAVPPAPGQVRAVPPAPGEARAVRAAPGQTRMAPAGPAAGDAAALVAPVIPAAKAVPTPTAATGPAPAPAPAPRRPEVREQAPQIARARAVAVTKTTPSRRLKPGDLICGNCGEGNPPSRKFCSRCGDSLFAAAEVDEPWWHRFRIKRGPRTVKLGTEPGKTAAGRKVGAAAVDGRHVLTQVYRKARLGIALVIVAAGVVYGAYPPFRNEVNSLFTSEKSKLSRIVDVKYVPIHPVKCTANVQDKAHPGGLVCDGFFNNYWLAPFSQSPEPTITMIFSHPVTITRLILYNGAFGHYVANGRPSSLHLVFSNDESFTITPEDSAAPQTFTIKHAILIKRIVVQVTATYQGTGKQDVAVSQIELFGIG